MCDEAGRTQLLMLVCRFGRHKRRHARIQMCRLGGFDASMARTRHALCTTRVGLAGRHMPTATQVFLAAVAHCLKAGAQLGGTPGCLLLLAAAAASPLPVRARRQRQQPGAAPAGHRGSQRDQPRQVEGAGRGIAAAADVGARGGDQLSTAPRQAGLIVGGLQTWCFLLVLGAVAVRGMHLVSLPARASAVASVLGAWQVGRRQHATVCLLRNVD